MLTVVNKNLKSTGMNLAHVQWAKLLEDHDKTSRGIGIRNPMMDMMHGVSNKVDAVNTMMNVNTMLGQQEKNEFLLDGVNTPGLNNAGINTLGLAPQMSVSSKVDQIEQLHANISLSGRVSEPNRRGSLE